MSQFYIQHCLNLAFSTFCAPRSRSAISELSFSPFLNGSANKTCELEPCIFLTIGFGLHPALLGPQHSYRRLSDWIANDYHNVTTAARQGKCFSKRYLWSSLEKKLCLNTPAWCQIQTSLIWSLWTLENVPRVIHIALLYLYSCQSPDVFLYRRTYSHACPVSDPTLKNQQFW